MSGSHYVAIGRVVKTHGLHGEVSVASAAGASLSSLIGVTVWFVPPGTHARSGRIEAVRSGPKGPLVAFEGLTDIDSASKTAGCQLLALKSDLPSEWLASLTPDPDIVGHLVVDGARGEIGNVVEVIHTGANDVLVVHGPFGEVLVPVIADVIDDVDEQAKTVHVTLLDGLIEDEARP